MDDQQASEGGADRRPQAVPPQWLAGGGEMGALMRATDWSLTRLGPIEHWPKSLQTMLGVILGSRFPMLLWWGPDLLHLYNDAYRPILRDKHPASLAAPAAEVWAEVWGIAGPMARSVQEGGPATWTEDLQLFIANGGMAEETYFTFSYSPVPGEDGRVGGLLNTVQETTAKVQIERQVLMLQELSVRAGEAVSADAAFRGALDVLAENGLDLPFVLLYLADDDHAQGRLIGARGWGWQDYAGPAKAPRIVLPAADDRGWPLAEVLRSGQAKVIGDLAARFGALPAGRWNGEVERAILLPLVRAGQSVPYAVLVAGISPHRVLDDRYQRFFRATAEQVMRVIANAVAFEEEAKRAAALAALDRAKMSFFSNVSHEFRTPLTLILGPVEDAIHSASASLSGEALELVRRNTQRLAKLVNDLLQFSRSESGQLNAAFEASELGALTAALAGIFTAAAEKAGLSLAVSCDPLPEPIYVDHDLWEKIVLNLLSNALKFTFAGGIGVAVRWHGDHAELEVRDSGTGIPADELPHLFERFHRVPGARSRSHEGSGIGLALVQDLVRVHGGSISVVSALRQGTTFTVSIPAGSAHLPAGRIVAPRPSPGPTPSAAPFAESVLRWREDAASGREQAPAAPAQPGRSPTRILVVDDNADMRGYVASILAPHYEVVTAHDGRAALAVARRDAPALVVSDVMMPRLDGFALLQEMRDDPALGDIPVILLSARAGDEATVAGLEAGADDYLVKPFSARELIARVRTHLALAQQRDELAQARDAAEAANRELSSFSYSVAHDLRAPLRHIDGFSAALVEDHRAGLAPEAVALLDRVRHAVQHMSSLIDGLLDLARITQGEIQREQVDISAIAHSAIARLEAGQPGRQVEVVIQEGITVLGDPRMLMVVLDNLIGNAWKFTRKREHARIEFGTIAAERQPIYFVRDNGAGFDMSYSGKLFGTFQRLHAAHEFEGTGIGLATVQRVIRRHHGRVWAIGDINQGATFFFTLHDQDRCADSTRSA